MCLYIYTSTSYNLYFWRCWDIASTFRSCSISRWQSCPYGHQGIWSLDNTRSIVLWSLKKHDGIWAWTVGALAFCERKYVECYNILRYDWLWLLLLSLFFYWLRLDILFWITVLHSWCCWFQDVLKMTSCQSCLSNQWTRWVRGDFVADPTAEVLKGWLESMVRYGRAVESKQGMLDDEVRYVQICFSINWYLQNRSCFELARSPAFATV